MGSSASEIKIKRWQAHIAAAETFAGGIEAYCRSQGLYTSSFYFWRKKLRAENPSQVTRKARTKFLPVTITAPSTWPALAAAPALPNARWVAEVLTYLGRGLS